MLRKLTNLAFGTVFILCAGTHSFAAEKHCNTSTIRGSFGYNVNGNINAAAQTQLPAGPFGAVGRLIFDGRGGVSTVRTLSANGIIIQDDVGSGSYSVDGDCTGSFNISIVTETGIVQLNLNMVISDNTDQIRAIVTNPGYILTLLGSRQ